MTSGEIRIGRREKIEKRKGEKNREEKEKRNGKNKIRKKSHYRLEKISIKSNS